MVIGSLEIRTGLSVVVVVGLWTGGCTAPRERLVVTHHDASVKIPAIKRAVHEKDRSAIPQLVRDLDHEDPAVRFYAINALEQLTGERLDYVYYEDEEKRRPAVKRWNEWLASHLSDASGG